MRQIYKGQIEIKANQWTTLELPFELMTVSSGICFNQIEDSKINGFGITFSSFSPEFFQIEIESISLVFEPNVSQIQKIVKNCKFYKMGHFSKMKKQDDDLFVDQ